MRWIFYIEWMVGIVFYTRHLSDNVRDSIREQNFSCI